MNFSGSLKWIDSTGGPLLLLEEHLLEKWHGAFVENSSNLESDYDRACVIDDYIGFVSVDSEYGVVLGDEPLSTAWMPLSQINKGLIVRWVFANNETDVIDSLSNLQEVKWEQTGSGIFLSGGRLILFDASCDGNHIDEKLEIEMTKGSYSIETSYYKPNSQTSLILHRFNPVL